MRYVSTAPLSVNIGQNEPNVTRGQGKKNAESSDRVEVKMIDFAHAKRLPISPDVDFKDEYPAGPCSCDVRVLYCLFLILHFFTHSLSPT